MASRRFRNNLLNILISISLLGTFSLFYHVRPLFFSKQLQAFLKQSSNTSGVPSLEDNSNDVALEMLKFDGVVNPPPPPHLQNVDRITFFHSTKIPSTPMKNSEQLNVLKKTPDDIFKLDQTDPKLISYIRQNHLIPPSKRPYANMSQYGDHSNGYSSLIKKLFRKKGDNYKGTFIEAGAYDGEVASNSLALEENGWTGILIECNPILLPKLLAKNRKAWIANVCLSPTNTPKLMNFTTLSEWPASAKLGRPLNQEEMKKHGIDWVKNKTWINYQIPCFPLYSIIAATGEFGSQIDFLSLDVEGAEIDILKSFPHAKFSFKTMFVEVHTFTPQEKTDLRDFIKRKGYELKSNFGNDDLYIKSTEKDLMT